MLPVRQAGEEVPAHVKVKAITAELIIEQDKAEKARVTTGKGGQDTAAVKSANVAMSDYKIGPGDVLNITVWITPN